MEYGYYYLIILVSSLNAAILNKKIKNRLICDKFFSNLILCFLYFWPIICFSSFRRGGGTDYWSYYSYSYSIGKMTISEYFSINGFAEIAFYFISKIGYLSSNRFLIYFLMTICLVYPLIKFLNLYRSKISPWVFVFIFVAFFFPKYLNISRQMIAVSYSLCSIGLIQYNFKRSLLYLLISILFHSSAIVVLAIYPLILYYVKFRQQISLTETIYIILLIFLFIYVFKNQLGGEYIHTYKTSNSAKFSLLVVLSFLLMFCYAALLIRFYIKLNKTIFSYMLMLLVGVLIYITFSNITVGFRLSYYFVDSLLFIYPYISNQIRNSKTKHIVNITIIVIFVFTFYLQHQFLGYDEIVPIHFGGRV